VCRDETQSDNQQPVSHPTASGKLVELAGGPGKGGRTSGWYRRVRVNKVHDRERAAERKSGLEARNGSPESPPRPAHTAGRDLKYTDIINDDSPPASQSAGDVRSAPYAPKGASVREQALPAALVRCIGIAANNTPLGGDCRPF
jgi:hypothetical protein